VNHTNKVIVQLRGGLGNQLFGFFAGLYLASTNNCSLVLDGSLIKFGSNPTRGFELLKVDLTKIRTPLEIRKPFPLPESRLGRRISRLFLERIASYLKRNNPNHVISDAEVLENYKVEGNVLLEGYFSTFSYFSFWLKNNSDFTFQPSIQRQSFLKCKNEIENLNALHIRLGDYLNHTDIYPIPSTEYYENALKVLGNEKGFVVFCENYKEAREHFPSIINNASRVISADEFDSVETLCLMASCPNLIAANSTFSQWAGVFVSSRNGRVIHPSKFLHNTEAKLAGKDWVKLDIKNGVEV
jgi:hypothetical protein